MIARRGGAPLPWLDAALRAARQTAQGHAVLLHGPRGVGQFDLALALAASWLCEADRSPRPCGDCAACRLLAARSHPDLLVLLPDAVREALGWSTAEEDAERAGKAKPSKEIRVEAVRTLVAFAQTTTARGRGKVAIVHPAERMNAIAANTLLKTLEEPPGEMRFVLATAAPDALLPTVRSRCQAIAVDLPEPRVAVAWLAEQGVQRPEVALAAAGGAPVDALDAVGDGLDAALWLRIPELVQRGDAAPLTGLPLPRLVDALQKLCHDLLCGEAGAQPRYYPADVLPGGGARDPLLAWSRTLRASARHADHPWHAGLAAESLILQGRRVFVAAAQRRRAVDSLHSAG
jgi:DNA polymerase-3 subunit delta'